MAPHCLGIPRDCTGLRVANWSSIILFDACQKADVPGSVHGLTFAPVGRRRTGWVDG